MTSFLSKIPKTAMIQNLPTTPRDAWDDLVEHGNCSKREKMLLRLFATDFSDEGVLPSFVTNDLLKPKFDALVAAQGADSPKTLWVVNGFITALIRKCVLRKLPIPPLVKFEGQRALEARQRDAIMKVFGDEIARLHEKHVISAESRKAEITAIRHCVTALVAVRRRPKQLIDLIAPESLSIIFHRFHADCGAPGTRMQVLRTLTAIANHPLEAEGGELSKKLDAALDQLMEEIHKSLPKSGLSNEVKLRLSPYLEPSGLVDIEDALVQAIDLPKKGVGSVATPPERPRLYRAQYALYVYMAIYSPAAFETIFDTAFTGEPPVQPKNARKFLVVQSTGENFETPLPMPVVGFLDEYCDYLSACGIEPASVFIEPSGAPRQALSLRRCIQVFLDGLGVNLSPGELRHLGVGVMAIASDEDKQMADAARMTLPAFKALYGEWVAMLRRKEDKK
jgi:hypothetical protein